MATSSAGWLSWQGDKTRTPDASLVCVTAALRLSAASQRTTSAVAADGCLVRWGKGQGVDGRRVVASTFGRGKREASTCGRSDLELRTEWLALRVKGHVRSA